MYPQGVVVMQTTCIFLVTNTVHTTNTHAGCITKYDILDIINVSPQELAKVRPSFSDRSFSQNQWDSSPNRWDLSQKTVDK